MIKLSKCVWLLLWTSWITKETFGFLVIHSLEASTVSMTLEIRELD